MKQEYFFNSSTFQYLKKEQKIEIELSNGEKKKIEKVVETLTEIIKNK